MAFLAAECGPFASRENNWNDSILFVSAASVSLHYYNYRVFTAHVINERSKSILRCVTYWWHPESHGRMIGYAVFVSWQIWSTTKTLKKIKKLWRPIGLCQVTIPWDGRQRQSHTLTCFLEVSAALALPNLCQCRLPTHGLRWDFPWRSAQPWYSP